MRWYQDLYLGELAALQIEEIQRKAKQNQWMFGTYYITLASNSHTLFDIFHNGMLSQKLFLNQQCMDVVGVAKGKTEAFEVIQDIVQDLYTKTGGFDVQAYFKKQDFVEN